MALLRSLLWTVPLIFAATIVMGSISLLASIVDGTGRLQHRIARQWARILLRISGVQVTVTGAENLTPGTAYVFCSNHLSLIDTPLVFGYLPWEFRILARKGLWSIPFLGWHLRRARHMPVARDDVRHSLRNLTDAAQRVAAGMSVVVFPEGTRSPDGNLVEFKAGAAYIAIKAGVPLAPMCILGTRQVHTEGSVIVRPGRAELHIGAPISTAGLTPRDSRQLLAKLRERVTEMVQSRSEGLLQWSARRKR